MNSYGVNNYQLTDQSAKRAAEQTQAASGQSRTHAPGALRLVYLIGSYPGLTTTFIDREIRTLRKWGVDLRIFAIHPPKADATLSADQRDLQNGIVYLLPAPPLTLLLAHLYFLLVRPLAYLRTFAYLTTRPHPSAHACLRTTQHFGVAVYAAYLLRRDPPAELHAHFVDRTATLALVASRLLGIPYSLSIHAGADVFVQRVLVAEKIAEARHAVTCTLHNRSYLEEALGQDLSHKISHVRHGLELNRYAPPQRPLHRARPLILSVGQLAPRKGFAQLVETCAKLRAQGYSFDCHIVGQGPQQAELEALIDAFDLHDMVTLCGALRHEDVIRQYQEASLFALLCIVTPEGDMDGIPNVIAEAMALAVPVVSTQVSAIPELVTDGVNGLLTAPGDTDAAATAIARLLDDPVLAARLALAARESILATFNVEDNVRRFAVTLWPEWFDETPMPVAMILVKPEDMEAERE